ncbi:MAG: GNAT family N-acetyltransferase [Chloroflexota bacterium]|nr:GNAT family N-acetyltransferase [Chloroflexota bacterium]MDQ5865539.1 GNAT family N-acetyltransferase [Chloroflexota bacterium]
MTSTLDKVDDTIYLPDAPDIPGLVFRHYRGESDLPGMVTVLDACRSADNESQVTTLDELQRQYANPKNCDLQKDVVMVEADGKLIGYNRVTWWKEVEDGSYVYSHWGFVHPDWRGKGIGRALFHRAEARIREIAAEHPADAPKFLDAGADDAVVGTTELIKSEGYQPIRHWYDMVRPNLDDIPDIPLPEGIEVRPTNRADREQMHKIWAAEVEAFKDHWGEGETEEADFERWGTWGKFTPELWMVAWEGEEVVGMVRNFIDYDWNARTGIKRGWTENISVRRPWRKKRIAKALIARSLHLLKLLGLKEAALGVDTENPSGALQLYQSMGYEVVKSGTSYRKPLALN